MTSVKRLIASLVDFQPKPRTKGLTMVMDTRFSLAEAQQIAESWGDYIDLIKFGWTTWTLLSEDDLREKINIYMKKDINVCPGGTSLELAYKLGKIDEFFNEIKEYGFNVVEVSNGNFNDIPKVELIKKAKKYGLSVNSEVGKKDPEIDAELTVEDRVREIQDDLKAGANYVIIEAREGGKGLGIYTKNGQVKKSDVQRIISAIGIEKLIFEAPLKNQQLWFLKNYGKDVNLANVSVLDVVGLATLRRGIRGDTICCLNEWSPVFARINNKT